MKVPTQYKGAPRIAPHTYGVADESLNIKDSAYPKAYTQHEPRVNQRTIRQKVSDQKNNRTNNRNRPATKLVIVPYFPPIGT